MKLILLFACACSLVFTTGCLSSSAEWHGHANNARFGGFTTGSPANEGFRPAGEVRAPGVREQ